VTSAARFRVVVVGEPDSCFRYCILSTEGRIVSGKNKQSENSVSGLPRDEWVAHLSVDVGTGAVTAELNLEIHGPWVWELYDIIPPREYFERYAGVIMVGDISRIDSLRDLARFIQVFDSYGAGIKPAVLVFDSSGHNARDELRPARQMFSPRFVRIIGVDFKTGEGAARPLHWIAARVFGSNPIVRLRVEGVL